MDMQAIQARFATQQQAEAAVRKLAALRGDQFRLERQGVGAADAAVSTDLADMDALGALTEFQPVDGEVSSFLSFSLSAVVPAMATEQARSVIADAGGQMM